MGKRKKEKPNLPKKKGMPTRLLYTILSVILVALAFVGIYFYGKHRISAYGFATSKETVMSFLNGIKDADKTKIEHSFDPDNMKFNDLVKVHYGFADEKHDSTEMYLSDTDIYYSATPYEEDKKVGEHINVEIPAVQKTEEATLYVVMQYEITTIQKNDKWYIDDIPKNDIIIVNAVVEKSTETTSEESTQN